MKKNIKISYLLKDDNQIEDYEKIPMLSENKSIYEVLILNDGLGGIRLKEKPVKIYQHDPSFGEGPEEWKKMFPLSNWGFYLAYDGDQPIAAMALAYKTKGCHMLSNRDDLVVVWDIRVSPSYKGQGIGKRLIDLAYAWAKERKCREIKVETQNNNVNACKFYQCQGFKLGTIDSHAYQNESETMLLWYKAIV